MAIERKLAIVLGLILVLLIVAVAVLATYVAVNSAEIERSWR